MLAMFKYRHLDEGGPVASCGYETKVAILKATMFENQKCPEEEKPFGITVCAKRKRKQSKRNGQLAS